MAFWYFVDLYKKLTKKNCLNMETHSVSLWDFVDNQNKYINYNEHGVPFYDTSIVCRYMLCKINIKS